MAWLADGTKYRVADASGNGVIYAGDLTLMVTISGGNTTYALESAEASADGTARFLKNGTAMTPYYTIWDHLGSVRTIVNASGTVVERNDYYPFGTRTTFGASYATLASNRQKFSGKEEQTAVAGSTLPYLDFGARMYDAKLVRWNTYDPMAEKYYGINPYVYCTGDPVNLMDPSGNDIWVVNKKGEISYKEQSEQHLLYSVDDQGNLSKDYVSTTTDNVIGGLEFSSKKSANGLNVYMTTSKSVNDIFKLFKFLADHTSSEWIVYKKGNQYVLGSLHESGSSGTLSDFNMEKAEMSIHSHPNAEGYIKEMESMGYWDNHNGTHTALGDWNNVRNHMDARIYNYVYFPKTQRLYNVEFEKPRYIRNIGNDYRRFFFGTLNNR